MKTTTEGSHTTTLAAPATVFSRVLVGVDGSEESYEAGRQAALLLEEGGELTILAAYDMSSALVGGTGLGVPAYLDEDVQRRRATKALEGAREGMPEGLAAKVVRGCPWAELLREVEQEKDTLIAVGSHGIGRARGIAVGSTVTEVVHKAPCSVLVVREVGPSFPRRIVAGVDSAPRSAAAYDVASYLAERFGAALQRLTADEPVEALVAASATADLVVVGSRGLHGLKALGSVSERVAHQAFSSVLIVRDGVRRA